MIEYNLYDDGFCICDNVLSKLYLDVIEQYNLETNELICIFRVKYLFINFE